MAEAKSDMREVVIPGEIITEGEDALPGDWTVKQGDKIVATRLGTVDKSDRLIRVVPISGVYIPRRGNTVIGEVTDFNQAGWSLDIKGPYSGFLTLRECPMFVAESEMENVYSVGDLIVVKLIAIKRGGIDVTTKGRGLGKVKDGLVIGVNPHRVPRVIGREGSMIRLIKTATNCNITVGQNGLVWIKGEALESEQLAKKAIEFVIENTTAEGLTEKVEAWLKEQGADVSNISEVAEKPEPQEEE